METNFSSRKKAQSINDLPDELLLKILSLLPMFKEAVATHVISKRWVGLWKLVPDLKFDDKSYDNSGTFASFIYRSLLRNNAQILETLHLSLSRCYRASHINFWVQTAVDGSVRELRIDLFGRNLRLPSCLSTCTTLTTLILCELSIRVVPRWFRLPSLKTLHLLNVKFSCDEAVASLLENCQVLEDLVVKKNTSDKVTVFSISVPTLRTLYIHHFRGELCYSTNESHGFVINAPSLMDLNINDTCSNFVMFEYMPKVIKANIEFLCQGSEKFIGSFPSIQHLSYRSKTPYPSGTSFSCLKHLELWTRSQAWWTLLIRILNHAPRLQFLKIKSEHSAHSNDPFNPFEEPAVIPECLLKHLKILEWRQYEGTDEERDVAEYILANATCLKMAAFSFRCTSLMLQQVKSMYRVSKTCQFLPK